MARRPETLVPPPPHPPPPVSAAEIRGSILFTRAIGLFLFVLVPTVSRLVLINPFIRQCLSNCLPLHHATVVGIGKNLE